MMSQPSRMPPIRCYAAAGALLGTAAYFVYSCHKVSRFSKGFSRSAENFVGSVERFAGGMERVGQWAEAMDELYRLPWWMHLLPFRMCAWLLSLCRPAPSAAASCQAQAASLGICCFCSVWLCVVLVPTLMWRAFVCPLLGCTR